MQNYKAIFLTTTGMPTLEFEFSENNDEDAIKYVERVLRTQMAGIRWFIGVCILTTSDEDGSGVVTFNYERRVAVLRLGDPIVIRDSVR